jgi:L-fucose mutarotase/ribose pyranase (RbsD/FucU family)
MAVEIRRLLLPLLLMAGGLLTAGGHAQAQSTWHDRLAHALPLLGQGNWIVVADPAFPLLTSPGVEVVATDLSQTDLLTAVLNALAGARHVRPVVLTDAELPYITEQDANGIKAYAAQMASLLKGIDASSLPQEQIEAKLEDAAHGFHVLVLKSTTTLPYSSVFIQLDSGYWAPDAERRLRAAIQTATPDRR